MNTKKIILLVNAIIIAITLLFTKCTNNNESESGQLNVKLTDAPTDDANIKGVFVTVAEVKVDGETVEDFDKQTIDLTAYQKGSAKLLVSDDVEVGTYDEISLVLDFAEDESGNSPGCYVLTKENIKHDLNATNNTTSEITLGQNFEVMSNAPTDMVVDFDLRKAVKYENENNSSSDYALVSDSELESALRVAIESETGDIKGKITETVAAGDQVVVYAYENGTFDAETETKGQGDGNIMFANAVTSSKVDMNNNYTLNYLAEGDYELHVASYDQDEKGKLAFSSMLEANSLSDGIVSNKVSVEAYAEVNLNLNLTGFIDL